MHSLATLLLAALPCAQDPAPRPAADILRDYGRVAMPSMSDGADPASVKRFHDAITTGCRRQAALALELFTGHPDHARVAELLEIRWAGLTNACDAADEVIAETRKLLAGELRDDVRTKAMHARTHALLRSDRPGNVERLKAVRDLIAADPEDERTGLCLLDFVEHHLGDPETMRPLLEVAAEKWPKSAYVGRPAKRWLLMLDGLGKPFAEQLPEALREPFAAATKDAVPFTVVQLWMGWVRNDGSGKADPELAALRDLRQQLGERVRLVGLLNGDLDERLAEARKAGVDWPQLRIEDPEPMKSPLGVPRFGVYFVLDGNGLVAGFCGSAKAAAARVRQLAEPPAGAR